MFVLGLDGVDGENGRDGKDGAPGQPGPPGPKGDAGKYTVLNKYYKIERRVTYTCLFDLNYSHILIEVYWK